MTRGPTEQGSRTREAITRTAADLASIEGLDGLTIRRLAAALPMSVSGLYAHFGSKEALQLATIEAARQVYVREVIEPALAAPPGVGRLLALCESFLSYVQREVFPGGCFFAAAMAEFDCKPGPVRDRIAELQADWLHTLQRAATDAVRVGELKHNTDVEQLAFDLEAALLSGNWYVHLFSDTDYLARARESVRRRVAAAMGQELELPSESAASEDVAD
jgi:AcrR family transcriptional regulator